MSHAQSKRFPKSRATQPCPRSVASQGASRCGPGVSANLLYLSPPGVSLPAASSMPEIAGSCWGFQGRLHGQALSNSGRQAAHLCIFDRADVEQRRQPCGLAVVEPRAKTWLKSRRMASRLRYGWNIGLIACWPKSSHKHTNCWYPNGAGWLILSKPDARRR